eukprot:Hpha_TRINITY_DN5045_c0_g1::TRINITY_DN5045_c0_g1_i1::g.94034::m.94034
MSDEDGEERMEVAVQVLHLVLPGVSERVKRFALAQTGGIIDAAAQVILTAQEQLLVLLRQNGTVHPDAVLQSPVGDVLLLQLIRGAGAAEDSAVSPPTPPATRPGTYVFEDPSALDALEIRGHTDLKVRWHERKEETAGGGAVMRGGDLDSGSDTSSGSQGEEAVAFRKARALSHVHHRDVWIDSDAAAQSTAGRGEAPESLWWMSWEAESDDGDLLKNEEELKQHREVFAGPTRQLDIRRHLWQDKAVFDTERSAALKAALAVLALQVVPDKFEKTGDLDLDTGLFILKPSEEYVSELGYCGVVCPFRVQGPVYLSSLNLDGKGSEWTLGDADGEKTNIDTVFTAGGKAPPDAGMQLRIRNAKAGTPYVQWSLALGRCCCCSPPWVCGQSGKVQLHVDNLAADVRWDQGANPATTNIYLYDADVSFGGLSISSVGKGFCCTPDGRRREYQDLLRRVRQGERRKKVRGGEPVEDDDSDEPIEYRYYRFRGLRPRNGGSKVCLGVVQFFSGEINKPPGCPVGTVAAFDPDGKKYSAECRVEALMQNSNPNGWTGASGSTVRFTLRWPEDILQYRVRTCESDAGLDAVSWTLEAASKEDGPWIVIDQREYEPSSGRVQFSERLEVSLPGGGCCQERRCCCSNVALARTISCAFCMCKSCAEDKLSGVLLEKYPPPGRRVPPTQEME